jgi:hypothetical protein
VTVTGAGITGQTSLRVNGELRPPTILSFTQLRVPLGAGDLGSSGTLELRLENPGPGGGSASTTLEVRAPVPVAASLLESVVVAGAESFTIYVNGTGFGYNSVVRFNGAARPTELGSMTQLKATLGADDLDVPGRFDITVATPAPGGGVSNAVQLQVVDPPSPSRARP